MSEPFREHFVDAGGAGAHRVATMTVPLNVALRVLSPRRGRRVSVQGIGVLLLNAGVIHRIGPHRINVKLARRLAESGIPSIRLDLSGLGDSRRPPGTASMMDQVRQDMRWALDALAAETGVERFVILGICSGAEYGYQYSVDDPRVVGLVMVDGYSFGNRRTTWLRYGLRLKTLTWRVLKSAVAGRLERWRRRRHEGAEPDAGPVDYGLPSLTAQDFAEGLSERVRRGCGVYLVYTGSILQRYNHASQFRDVMKTLPLPSSDREALERVRCDFMPEIDHTLSTLDGQSRFMERVCRWLDDRLK